jgi:transcriptional regulator with XRE-family HTH domain
MNGNYFTKKDQKKERYLKALTILHDIKQADIVKKHGVSASLVSQVISGKRKGVKKKGRVVLQEIADTLGMKVEDLLPKRAA